jgi:hypothetical protein
MNTVLFGGDTLQSRDMRENTAGLLPQWKDFTTMLYIPVRSDMVSRFQISLYNLPINRTVY